MTKRQMMDVGIGYGTMAVVAYVLGTALRYWLMLVR